MVEMVTLQVSRDAIRQAKEIARRTQRRYEDVLAEWLDHVAHELPVEMLPDEDVLALAEMQLPEAEQRELSDLLADNREGQLDEAGRARLDALMEIYRRGLVRKAEALRVAVERELRPPLS